MSAKCPKCSAPIFWASTARDKAMMMDAAASLRGDYRLIDRGAGMNPLAERVTPCSSVSAALKRYTCHFDTCKAK